MALIRIGTAGWGIPAPLKAQFSGDGTQLERYAARMNAVEINSSFYRPHQRKTYERWAASTPEDFHFSVKLPRSITHEGRLRNFEAPLTRFLDEIAGLGEKLGVILVQLPPGLAFDAAAAASLFKALSCHTLACEPRHASWFMREAEDLLRRHHVARVAADPPRHADDGKPGGDRRLAYYRWHGSPEIYRSKYDDNRLASLARILQAETARQVWCIFDNTAAGAALDDALRLAAGTKAQGTPYQGASKEDPMARKYSKGASKKVEKAMHERKEGTLKSGRSGKKVKSRKQAIAIGLSEARAEGKKVPKRKTAKRKAKKAKSAKKR